MEYSCGSTDSFGRVSKLKGYSLLNSSAAFH
jgi:hypothetical protein